jgi:predicted ATPase
VGAVLAAARSTPLPGSTPILNVPETVIDRAVQDGLRQLVRADLAFPREGSKYSDEQEYYFKNSYLREVAYDLIPNRNRAQYHSAVAEWMLNVQNPALQPAFQSMAREHERKAASSANLPAGAQAPGLN